MEFEVCPGDGAEAACFEALAPVPLAGVRLNGPFCPQPAPTNTTNAARAVPTPRA